MTLEFQAGLMSLAEVATLGVAFHLWSWRRWAGWMFAIPAPMMLCVIDGHFYWDHHALFGLLPN